MVKGEARSCARGGGEGAPGVVVEVGVGGATVHEARVAEQVLRGPQKLDARGVLLLQRVVAHGVEVFLALSTRGGRAREG